MTIATHADVIKLVPDKSAIAEVNIHLRARSQDRNLIDQAAKMVGANRSQFILNSALKEARDIVLNQSIILADAPTFGKVLDWLDAEPMTAEAEGMARLLNAPKSWLRD